MMTELAIAGWAVAAIVVFLPVGSVVGMVRGRRRPAPAHGANAVASSSLALVAEMDAPFGALGGAAPGELEPALATPAGDAAGAPAIATGEGRFWRMPLPVTIAFYVVFVATSIYLVPRLLAQALDTPHPMAAITSESMYPTLKEGDLVLMEGVDSKDDLRIGDIIAFEHEGGFAIHRIVRISDRGIITKGDANAEPDDPIAFSQVIGRALSVHGNMAKIPYLGNIPLIFGESSAPEGAFEESEPDFGGTTQDIASDPARPASDQADGRERRSE